MGDLLNFSIYNPANLDDKDFLAGFVARQTLVEDLMNELRKHDVKDLARHQLIIGQRGMGKTSLLRRIALGVAQDPALSQIFIPLTFREEQYNVLNLRQFWINCLDALGNYFDRADKNVLADEVDRGIAKILAQPDDSDGEAALALLKVLSKREDRRLLLLLDNIDFIFDGLNNQQGWRLRNVLQEPGGIVVAGAAAGFVEAAAKTDMPFYDFFHVTVLEKLSPEELLACLRTFAKKRGEEGIKVLDALDRDPARILTLYDLTGGNPRTLVLLYVLLELNVNEDVMSDLERLLDQVTVMYKARVEDLAPQARAVLDAIALHWDPISSAQVAQATGLENASVSSQIDRLIRQGIVEKVGLPTSSPTGYQLGERFFNIWYLMRHGQRRQRAKLRWLTQCLRSIYTPKQLADVAAEFMKRPTCDRLSKGLFGLALSEAVTEPWLRDLLNHYGTRELEQYSRESLACLANIVDIADLHGSTHEMAELEQQVEDSARDWGSVNPQEFWKNLSGSASLSRMEKKRIAETLENLTVEQIEELFGIFQMEKNKFHEVTGLSTAFDRIWQAVGDGCMVDWKDFRTALGLAKNEKAPAILLVALEFSDEAHVDSLSGDEIGSALELLAELFSGSTANELNALAWRTYGGVLKKLGRFAEAEIAHKKVTELEMARTDIDNPIREMTELRSQVIACSRDWGKVTAQEFWENLGGSSSLSIMEKQRIVDALDSLTVEQIEELIRIFQEEKRKFHEVTGLPEAFDRVWRAVGDGSMSGWMDIQAALELARQETNPEILVVALEFGWGRHVGALKESELNLMLELLAGVFSGSTGKGLNGIAWSAYARFLMLQKKLLEAEAACRSCIEVNPEDAWIWNTLGDILTKQFGRHKEAEAAYRKAIELNPEEAMYWHDLGILLAGQPKRHKKAEDAYRKAIELKPEEATYWRDLGVLLAGQPKRHGKAEDAYRKAIELNPEYAMAWNNLGNLLAGRPERNEKAEEAYRKAIQLEPKYALYWVNLGDLLTYQFGRHEEAETAYRKAIELDTEFAWGWGGLGRLLRVNLGRYEEAEAAYRKAIELNPEYSGFWSDLGNLLQDHLGGSEEAEQAYRESLKLKEGDVFTLVNLAYLLLSQTARQEEAEQHFQAAMEKLPPHGAALLRAYRALAGDNFGEAVESLASALESNHPEILDTYDDDLLRILRLAAERGYGEKLLAWFDESGFGDRYWPFRAAFDAYLHGEAWLRGVNPEVRGAASRIYTWLDSRRAHLARLQPVLPTTTKRGRRKSSSALKR